MSEINPKLERISGKTILQSVLDNFNINKGVLKTLKLLILEPGKAIQTYFYEDRKVLIKSFRLLIFSTAIAALLSINLADKEKVDFLDGVRAGYNASTSKRIEANEITQEKADADFAKLEGSLVRIEHFTHKYFNLILLSLLPFMALASFWMFGKSGYNFAEHLVLNAYILSFHNIIFILFIPLIYSININFIFVYMIVAYAYMIYVYIRLFETKVVEGILRSIVAIMLNTTLYYFFMIVAFFVAIIVMLKGS